MANKKSLLDQIEGKHIVVVSPEVLNFFDSIEELKEEEREEIVNEIARFDHQTQLKILKSFKAFKKSLEE